METLSRWLKKLGLTFTSSQSYTLQDAEPQLIRRRLDRYTTS